jgi:hypothetical protein
MRKLLEADVLRLWTELDHLFAPLMGCNQQYEVMLEGARRIASA